MKYTVTDICEWAYPDIRSYATSADSFRASALRGGYASLRLLLWDINGTVTVKADGAACEIYEQAAIPVEDNPNFDGEELPHFPERKAPFSVYDCIKPSDGIIAAHGDTLCIRLVFPVPIDAAEPLSAVVTVTDEDGALSFPAHIIPKGKMPAETLKIAMGFSRWQMCRCHGLEWGSPAYYETELKYLKMLRRGHQNLLFLDAPDIRHEGGEWRFEFSGFNRQIRLALSLGFTGFMLGGIGFRRAWDSSEILIRGMDALSLEAYKYLKAYFAALLKDLGDNGWDTSMFLIGIADEPNEYNATSYRALAGTVRKLCPKIRIYDAVSYVPVYGAVDVWVPRSDEYMLHRDDFEQYRESGDEIWHYVCLYPRKGGFVNRFTDIPLLASRYLYWGNYRYSLSGYLHWAVNNYQSEQNPFEASCPVHINAGSKSILPPGDDRLIYPGSGEPWMSERLEAQREGAEDFEMLRIIAASDKALADSLCERCFCAFNDVEFDPVAFRRCRDEILDTYDKICE